MSASSNEVPTQLNPTGFRILILEDELYFQQKLRSIVQKILPESELTVLDSVPVRFELPVDLAILDISLNQNRDGIEFLEEYGDRISNVIFYSICTDRIKDAFGRNVLGFIEKTDPNVVLERKLIQIKNKMEQRPGTEICVKDSNGRTRILKYRKISAVQRTGRTVYVSDLQGEQFRSPWETIAEAGSSLPAVFFQINRSEFINTDCIESLDLPEIRLTSGETFFTSRSRTGAVRQFLSRNRSREADIESAGEDFPK